MHKKEYIKRRPETAGVRAKDAIPNFVIIGNSTRGGGGWNPSQVGPTNKSLILVPQTQGRGVQSWNMNGWTAFWHHDIIVQSWYPGHGSGGGGGGNGPFCPHLNWMYSMYLHGRTNSIQGTASPWGHAIENCQFQENKLLFHTLFLNNRQHCSTTTT